MPAGQPKGPHLCMNLCTWPLVLNISNNSRHSCLNPILREVHFTNKCMFTFIVCTSFQRLRGFSCIFNLLRIYFLILKSWVDVELYQNFFLIYKKGPKFIFLSLVYIWISNDGKTLHFCNKYSFDVMHYPFSLLLYSFC